MAYALDTLLGWPIDRLEQYPIEELLGGPTRAFVAADSILGKLTTPPDTSVIDTQALQATEANATANTDAIAAAIGNVPAGIAAMLIAAGLGQYVSGSSGPLQWTAAALALGPSGGLTAQQIVDAVMKLAPTAGTPAAGSAGALLAQIETAVEAIIMPAGAVVKTIQTNDVNGNPVAGVYVWTSSDSAGRTMVSQKMVQSDAGGLATILLLPGVQWVQMMAPGFQSPAPQQITI